MLSTKSVGVKVCKKEKVLQNMQKLKKITDQKIHIHYLDETDKKPTDELLKVSKKRMNLSQIIFL